MVFVCKPQQIYSHHNHLLEAFAFAHINQSIRWGKDRRKKNRSKECIKPITSSSCVLCYESCFLDVFRYSTANVAFQCCFFPGHIFFWCSCTLCFKRPHTHAHIYTTDPLPLDSASHFCSLLFLHPHTHTRAHAHTHVSSCLSPKQDAMFYVFSLLFLFFPQRVLASSTATGKQKLLPKTSHTARFPVPVFAQEGFRFDSTLAADNNSVHESSFSIKTHTHTQKMSR